MCALCSHFNKRKVLGHEVLAVVHDEDAAHVQLDVALLLLRLEQVERSALGREQEGAELQLALHAEVLHGQVLLPILSYGAADDASIRQHTLWSSERSAEQCECVVVRLTFEMDL